MRKWFVALVVLISLGSQAKASHQGYIFICNYNPDDGVSKEICANLTEYQKKKSFVETIFAPDNDGNEGFALSVETGYPIMTLEIATNRTQDDSDEKFIHAKLSVHIPLVQATESHFKSKFKGTTYGGWLAIDGVYSSMLGLQGNIASTAYNFIESNYRDLLRRQGHELI